MGFRKGSRVQKGFKGSKGSQPGFAGLTLLPKIPSRRRLSLAGVEIPNQSSRGLLRPETQVNEFPDVIFRKVLLLSRILEVVARLYQGAPGDPRESRKLTRIKRAEPLRQVARCRARGTLDVVIESLRPFWRAIFCQLENAIPQLRGDLPTNEVLVLFRRSHAPRNRRSHAGPHTQQIAHKNERARETIALTATRCARSGCSSARHRTPSEPSNPF